ncbi:alpha/beta-hydrolase [Gonapodya prolifera JEL478]|uniref:Alpha/beta-hydrolase n=1 Tax=Gonapodya prolifera (strain JEL478) TaxID=1344416 RepID=A0A138ZXE6_GONPJ|nr:alpha/beta-hydrolase [Gonapodya prolifera JEL478]|eukprot:KXS08965.1 alpha/beta-hydrolase [Gonapodya prolifera JEL478]
MTLAAKRALAFGTWKSPINAESLAASAISISDVVVDISNGWIYRVENRPSETPARGVVVRVRPTGLTGTFESRELNPPPFNARTGVHEYGGAPLAVHGGIVVFSDYRTRRLWLVRDSEGQKTVPTPVPITPDDSTLRYADLHISPIYPHDHLLCVREAHSKEDDHAEPRNSIVRVAIPPAGAEMNWKCDVEEVVAGADFYSDPKYSPDGKTICYLSWNHPNMPWTGTLLHLRDVSGASTTIAGSLRSPAAPFTGGESIAQPSFSEDGTLYYTTDREGFWALQKWSNVKGEPVLKQSVAGEFAEPAWVFGRSNRAHLSHDLLLTSYTVRATSRLALVHVPSGTIIDLPSASAYTSIGSLRAVPIANLPAHTYAAVATAGCGSMRTSMVLFLVEVVGEPETADDVKLTVQIIKETSSQALGLDYISEPLGIEFETRVDRKAHAIFYSPKNAEFSGLPEEKPPCVVNVHGGPTAHYSPTFDLQTQFWTTRGWAVCQLNYGGSTGYGREYVSRLDTKWGVTDVEDAIAAVKYMAESGLVDSKRICIQGGSAGGFTVLLAMALPLPYIPFNEPVFAAGTSMYGVADLKHLAKFTHKFEARYLDGLIGGTISEVPELYTERSPITYAANVRRPLLILQGSVDKIVPPEQSELIVKAVRDNGSGVRVDYVLYEGEGHGFREANNIADAVKRRLNFYSNVVGIKLESAE